VGLLEIINNPRLSGYRYIAAGTKIDPGNALDRPEAGGPPEDADVVGEVSIVISRDGLIG